MEANSGAEYLESHREFYDDSEHSLGEPNDKVVHRGTRAHFEDGTRVLDRSIACHIDGDTVAVGWRSCWTACKRRSHGTELEGRAL